MSGIEVTVRDLETGETQTAVIDDDYLLITAGNVYRHGVTTYANGTHVITVKRNTP